VRSRKEGEKIGPHSGDGADTVWDFFPAFRPVKYVLGSPRLFGHCYRYTLPLLSIWAPDIFIRIDGQDRDVYRLPLRDAINARKEA
jgi:hypothetical protein